MIRLFFNKLRVSYYDFGIVESFKKNLNEL